MEWGTRNPHGYRAASIPVRLRLFSSVQTGVLLAAIAWFFGRPQGTALVLTLAVTFGITTTSYYLMAWVADLAARQPGVGISVAALSGAGAGSLWWALTQRGDSIWQPLLIGVCGTLMSVYQYGETLRSLGPPRQPGK